MHARAGPAKSVRSLGLRLATLGGFARAPLGAREPTAPTPRQAPICAAASGVRSESGAPPRARVGSSGRESPAHCGPSPAPFLARGVPATSGCGGEVGASPDRGRTAMMACVVREGRDLDTKGARQAEGPRWAARSGPSDGPGPGGGVAGYSRELLRGALLYAGRGIPVFPCEPGGKRPLTADGFLEATTEGASIRRWWGRWPNANVAIPTGERSGLLVLDVDALRRHGLDGPARTLLRPAPEDLVRRDGWGRGASIFPIPFRTRVEGGGPLHAAGEEQPGTSRGRPGRARREGTSPAVTSWPRPAARCEPTGGSIGRLPPVPPGCSSI
jgi:hypothetical protein